jgi:hypothetical protein
VLLGQWVETLPDGMAALAESTLPRFLVTLPFDGASGGEFVDLGVGAEVENLWLSPRDDRIYLVAAVATPHNADGAIAARALLEVRRFPWTLLSATPLERDSFTRGFAVERHFRRAFFLDDDGIRGTVRVMDLYSGREVARRSVGTVPAAVGRKGLAVDREADRLFVLTGGEISRSDFQPLGADESAPALVALDADSLDILGTIPLDEGFEPRVVIHDPEYERVAVLLTNYRGSRVVMIDAGFLTVRTRIDLPEDTTDMVLSGGHLFCPGAGGLYIVDLAQEMWVSRSVYQFEQTGETAISGDQALALVQFRAGLGAATPGMALVDLRTGQLRSIWN